MSETRRPCGVPSERVFLYPGVFPGFAPWAGMRCPYRAWDGKRGGGPGIGNVAVDWIQWSTADTLERDARLEAWTWYRNAIVPFDQRRHTNLMGREATVWEHGRVIGNVIRPMCPRREVNQLPDEDAGLFCRVFPGFAPWAGMRCPVGAW